MFDEDEVLNLEEKFYQEGYQDGRHENLEKNLLEGRQYGLQVSFQRVQILGQIKSICAIIKAKSSNNSLVNNCQTIIESVEALNFSNSETDVKELSESLVKIKNKFRLVLMVWNKSNKNHKILYEDVFAVSRQISGNLAAYSEDSKEVEPLDETIKDVKHDW